MSYGSSREKKHSNPDKPSRNERGKLASARLRQLKKRNQQLTKKLKGQ